MSADMSDFDKHMPKTTMNKIESILDDLQRSEPERAEALLEALHDPKYTSGAIARTLYSWGIDVHKTTIHAWRSRL